MAPITRHRARPTGPYGCTEPAAPRRCAGPAAARAAGRGTARAGRRARLAGPRTPERPRRAPRPVPLAEVSTEAARPLPTGVGELDRVLGGGVVPGSVTLLVGGPGVGKSTLLLQVLSSVAAHRRSPSCSSRPRSRGPGAPAGRAPRARCRATCLVLEAPTSRRSRPPSSAAARPSSWSTRSRRWPTPTWRQPAGSLAQVRACVERLIRLAKIDRVPLVLVGPRHQGRRPGRPAGRRAPGRHRALLRGRPPPRPARADARRSTASVRPASSGSSR